MEWKTQNPNYGYNITAGGNGVIGFHHSEATKEKISESAKQRTGCKNPNYGNKWTKEMKTRAAEKHKRENLSDETLQKMSEAASKRQNIKNPFWGHTHTNETKKRISEAQSVAVDKFSKDMVYICSYPSMRAAAAAEGINPVGISNCCRGITKTSGGFIWKYK